MLQQERRRATTCSPAACRTPSPSFARAAFACVDLDAERYLRVDAVARARARARRPASATRARRASGLGWEPSVSFEQLVERMVRADLRARAARRAARPGSVRPRAPYTGPRVKTVGIIGLGYVGLPLAVAFAQEGCEVVARRRRLAQDRARSRRATPTSRTSRRRAAARGRASASTRRRATRGWRKADAVLICVPTPLTRNREPDLGPLIDAARGARRGAAGRPARRARVDDLPGHDARARRAAARGVGARRRARLPPGLLARARRPGPHRLHAAQHAEGARRADRGLRASAPRSSTAWSATSSCASPAPRRPS